MTKFEKLKGLAGIFQNFGKQPEKKEGFEAMKVTGSETMVEFDPELPVGSPVMVSSGTGSVPAPDNTYKFDNGVEFTTKDGLIETVISDGKTPVEMSEEEKEAAKKKEEELATEVVTMEMYNDLLARVTALEGAPKEDFSKLPNKEDLNKFTEHLAEVGKVIVTLSEIAVETPITVDKEEAEKTKSTNFGAVASVFTSAQTN